MSSVSGLEENIPVPTWIISNIVRLRVIMKHLNASAPLTRMVITGESAVMASEFRRNSRHSSSYLQCDRSRSRKWVGSVGRRTARQGRGVTLHSSRASPHTAISDQKHIWKGAGAARMMVEWFHFCFPCFKFKNCFSLCPSKWPCPWSDLMCSNGTLSKIELD